MRHWLQIATRSWRTRIGRSSLALLSITLGVGVVVWVTCCYESVRLGVTEAVLQWIGRSHVIVEPAAGVWGLFEDDIENLVKEVPGIRHTTTRTREYVEAAPLAGAAGEVSADEYLRIEITGIEPGPEKEPLFRIHNTSDGRFIAPGDTDAIVVERLLAREFGLSVGDAILLRHHAPPNPPRRFTVVGIVDRRRASGSQALMTWAKLDDVQTLCKLPNMVKAVDIIVTDPTVNGIRRIADDIREIIDKRRVPPPEDDIRSARLEVKTTEAQHKKLGAAQGLLQFIMMMLSCVVLLTALFIILATMSMGVTERITELGFLRCIGVTRRQLAGLLLLQTVPIGVAGTLLGVPLGLGLQWLTIQAVPDYLGRFAVNPWGMILAVCGGMGTTLLGAALPAVRAFEVSPVEATRTAGDPRATRWAWLACGMGALFLLAHEWVGRSITVEGGSLFVPRAIAGVVLLYVGCALMAPAVVLALGRSAVSIAARLVGLRPQLLGDEIAKAPFRSAAISCGLMVGLSLIVGLVVWGGSVKKGWQFPKEFPDAMLYTYRSIPLDRIRALRDTEGIAEFTVTDDFPFSLKPPSKIPLLRRLSILDQFSRCLAIDPDEGLSIIKLVFIEGDERDAKARLKEGGHLLVTREFARAQNKRLGDKLRIWVGQKSATFTIAGVVASPGLDIAISFFNATTYFQTYAVGAIIGTLDDSKRLFGREYGKLILFNFDLDQEASSLAVSDEPEPIGNGPGRSDPRINSSGRQTFALGEGPVPGDGPEERVVNRMLERLGYPPKAFVTARVLKQQIDRSIDRVTLLLSAIPIVALLIAALGLGNLMAANVASRARDMAILRAIGVTKSQLSRMIIGEAVVLALIGSAMGLGLGLALARTSNRMTEVLGGFQPEFSIPWELVGGGAALATLLCGLAALVPALRAGRSNIVAALSDL